MIWNWDFAISILPDLLKGLVVTLQAVVGGTAIALVLGLAWTLARRSPRHWIAWPVASVVEFVRSTPLLVQVYFWFYVFPVIGVVLSPLAAGILALGLHYSCYMSEVYRAGIAAVPRGQWEAAAALNMTRGQTYRRVILPQAIPPIIPPLGNYVIAMFKDTPLLSAITVLEILQRAKIVGNETFRYLELFTMVGVIFMLLSLIAGALVSSLQRRLKVEHA